MIALDGNTIAGDLLEVFGVDLSGATSVCATCGTSSFVAEAVVYMRGPGRVARCRSCGQLQIVLVTIGTSRASTSAGSPDSIWRSLHQLRMSERKADRNE